MTVGLKTARYVKALFAVAEARGERAAICAELTQLAGQLCDTPELEAALLSPRLERSSKRRLLEAAGLSSASPLLVDFVGLCLDHGRPEVIVEAPEEFLRLDREARGVLVATVQTVAGMSPELRTSVQARLEESTGKSIELKEETNPELLGGLRLLIGSRMYDGSLKRRLDDLTAHLQSTRVH